MLTDLQKLAADIQSQVFEIAKLYDDELFDLYSEEFEPLYKRYIKLVEPFENDAYKLQQAYLTDKQFKKAYDQLIRDFCELLDRLDAELEADLLDELQKIYMTTRELYEEEKPNVLDSYVIMQVINQPWCNDGLTYKDRIWRNNSNFKSNLSNMMLQSVMKGIPVQTTGEEIKKQFGTKLHKTKSLTRTEAAAMYTRASRDSFTRMGYEYYEILGEAECGDEGLCPVGEVYRVDEMSIGNDAPPFHPNCKCCIVPYDGDFSD